MANNMEQMEALMDNPSLSWPDRFLAARQVVDMLHDLLEEQAAQAKRDLDQALYEAEAGRDI